MSVTNQLIAGHSNKEQAAFIAFIKKRNKRTDTRNIQLYKLYLKGTEKNLLQEINQNAFNALKKRLTDLLIEFTANHTLANELSSENKIIKLIVIARKLIVQNHFKSGYKLLEKAELTAKALDHHSLLNEIYHTMIEHSHKLEKVDLNSLFLKLQRNNDQFLAQEKLSVLYASMHQEFISGKFNKLHRQLETSFTQGLKRFDINPELALNFKSLNQLCVLTDLYGSRTKNYNQVDLFFEKQMSELEGTDKDTEKMLPYHIELLYGMANIYFRKRDLSTSQDYLKKMAQQMRRYSAKHYANWEARHKNMLALIFNFSGSYEAAIYLISETLVESTLNDQEKALLTLSLTMFSFQQENLEEVKSLLGSLRKTDNWYLKFMGNEWLFNFKAMEILMHFDLGNDLLVESRINSFKRKYGNQVKNEKDNPIWPFLKLIQTIIYNHDHITSTDFRNDVEKSIPWKGENEDFFNMCFYAWLKAKMNSKPVYETTLELIKQ